jgi:hypothetical protein
MATKKAAKKTTRSARVSKAEEGPLYRLLKDSIIDNALKPAGAEVVYYGLPGSALYPINDEAKARKIEVRDIRRDNELDDEEKAEALKALSDEWNGVEAKDEFAESDDFDDDFADNTGRRPNVLNTKPLPDGERAELEKHAQASVEATKLANEDNTNKVGLQLQGDPSDPEGKQSKAGLQGHTPVLDKGGKK